MKKYLRLHGSGYFYFGEKEEKQMKVLEIISPVLVMIILGILCRKWKLPQVSAIYGQRI